jgi:hypothetical protein
MRPYSSGLKSLHEHLCGAYDMPQMGNDVCGEVLGIGLSMRVRTALRRLVSEL